MTQPMRILVLCTGNSCRSQMSEGFFRHFGNGQVEVYSAGTHPKPIHPMAIQVMREIGIDVSTHSSNYVFEYIDKKFDYVITVCKDAEQACPVFPGAKKRLDWPFDDPAKATGTEQEILSEFRRVRDEIGARVKGWVEETLEEAPKSS